MNLLVCIFERYVTKFAPHRLCLSLSLSRALYRALRGQQLLRNTRQITSQIRRGNCRARRFVAWYQVSVRMPRKVDVRLPGKGNSDSHGARPVHLIITMITWIRTSRLSIKNSLCAHAPSEATRADFQRRSDSPCWHGAGSNVLRPSVMLTGVKVWLCRTRVGRLFTS